jgi:hypothetical protein
VETVGVTPNEQPQFGEIFDDKKLLDYFWRKWKAADAHASPVLKEAKLLYAMYAAQAMLERDTNYIKETFRLPIELPIAKGVIDTVAGIAMAQGLEPAWKGVDQEGMSGEVDADWLTQVVKNCRSRCMAFGEEREAFFDKLISGYGFTDNLLDLTRVPIRPRTEHVEIDEVRWDPDARKPNLEDSTFWIRFKDWNLEEAQARWSAKAEELKLAISSGTVQSFTPTTSGTSRFSRSTNPANKVRVFDFQYSRWQTKVVYFDPETQQRADVVKSEFTKKQADLENIAKAQMTAYAGQVQQAQAAGLQEPEPPQVAPRITEFWEYQSPVWYRAYVVGNSKESKGLVLSHEAISVNEPTLKCDTGFAWKDPEAGTTRFFGLMRVVADAQLYLNRAMSEWLEIMARGVKGGGFIPKGALGNMKTVDEFLKDAAKPGFWHVVEDGYEGRIQFNPTQAVPAGFREIFQMMIEMFGRLTGVTEWLQGTGTADRANVLVSNMQEQGQQMLAPIFSPHKMQITNNGKIMAAIALRHLPARELDRILGPQQVEGVTHEKDPQTGQLMPVMSDQVGPDGQPVPVTPGLLLKDADLLEYDVVVDVAVATPTQRAVASQWWSDQGTLATFLQNGAPPKIILPEVVEISPMPGVRAKKMADALRAYFEQQEQQQTDQGIIDAMNIKVQTDPNGAMQLLQQIAQEVQRQISGTGGQQPAGGQQPPAQSSGQAQGAPA